MEVASAVANKEEVVKATVVVATSVAGLLAVAVATEAAAVAIESEDWNWVMVALVAAAMVVALPPSVQLEVVAASEGAAVGREA